MLDKYDQAPKETLETSGSANRRVQILGFTPTALTHQRALHPDTLRYLVEASGFRHVDIRLRHPVHESDRLPSVSMDEARQVGETVARLATVINQQADTLNARLFSFTDYAIIARR